MSEENKNLKVTSELSAKYETDTHVSDRQISISLSYTKTNKLITALYMVTDIMDKEEPLRNKLRILGSDVVSDTHLVQHNYSGHLSNLHHSPKHTANKISEIISFLDIASAIGMISEMNCNILKKEFTELKQSLHESHEQAGLSLSDLFPILNDVEVENVNSKNDYSSLTNILPRQEVDKEKTNSIGVQKGSTLLKALSQVVVSDSKNKVSNNRVQMSNKTFSPVKNKIGHQTSENDFDILKKKRREEVTKIVKENKEAYPAAGGATITDIRTGAKGVLVSCGEKTLQRELVSMVKDGVLKKTGEKRWSKYFL